MQFLIIMEAETVVTIFVNEFVAKHGPPEFFILTKEKI